jgi:hypothetical protein
VVNYSIVNTSLWPFVFEFPAPLQIQFLSHFCEFAGTPTPSLVAQFAAIRSHFREGEISAELLNRLLPEMRNPAALTALAFFARWIDDLNFADAPEFQASLSQSFDGESEACRASLLFVEKLVVRGRIDWIGSFGVVDKITTALSKWRSQTDVWVAAAKLTVSCGYASLSNPSLFNVFIQYSVAIFLPHPEECIVFPVLPFLTTVMITLPVQIPPIFS